MQLSNVDMDKHFVYRTEWVTHKWTWRQLMSVNGNMSITMSRLFTYTGHNVQLMSECHKLWLPNYLVIPSYPGIHPRGLALLDYFGYRLLDGSLSCFDPGFYPQVLSNESIHHTFSLRPPHSPDAPAIVENCAKWACLTTH